MPNKLTDAEIKKALECCTIKHDCNECPYKVDKCKVLNGVLSDALDLINRQEGEKEKNENIIRIADKTIATLNAEIRHLDQESDILRADVENLNRICDEVNAENESLKAEVERLNNNIYAMATTLSTSARATRHEAYKNCVEKSEKAIFIKQDDRRKEMLEILKTYRGTRTYSDTEQATDNWLRGYGEAVQDVLGVFYNLFNELVGDGNSAYIDKQN